jgi:hypothetical protein
MPSAMMFCVTPTVTAAEIMLSIILHIIPFIGTAMQLFVPPFLPFPS